MDELYSTTDMNLATVISINYPIKELVIEGTRGTFYFENSDELQDFITSFWDKELKVEPNLLFSTLKNIKNRLYVNTRKNI